MKKFIKLLLAAFIAFAMVGCSGSGDSGSSDEPVKLKFALSTLMVVPSLEATDNVEKAINDYLKTIGETEYEIELEIISIADYFTTVPMALSGKEGAPDIVQVFSLADFASQGLIVPLTQYMDNELKGTKELIGNVLGSGKMSGEVYMIPRYFGTVLDWKFVYNKDMVEAANVDLSNVDSLTALEEKLAELKVAYPEEHFLAYTDQFDDLNN